ncbi:MAG: hypothetical protein K6C32_03410 [Bacilli bacterium]|nr:hypothetical protein [Bacilli bacterium]
MKRVLFLTKRRYPDGDASSKRDCIFAKYFIDRGYEVVFIGMGRTPYKKVESIDGVSMVSLKRYKNPNFIQKILNHLFVEKKIVNYGIQHYGDSDIIFSEPNLFKTLRKRIKSFKTQNIIYSSVEFYSPSEYPLNGLFSSGYHKNIFFNTKIKPSDGKVIAISNYLKNHFANMNMKVVAIPFVINNKDNKLDVSIANSEKRRFIYCGNPRKKDLLCDILIAFTKLPDALLSKCEVDVIGIDNKWLLKQKISKDLKNKILTFSSFKGSLPFSRIIETYKSYDYSLLLRPFEARYAKAGFPTKISESLEYGVPPVTNFTSDLGLYLKNEINCIEVHGDTSDAFKDALVLAISKTIEEIRDMKINAKKTAVEKLDIKNFYKEMDEIVNN